MTPAQAFTLPDTFTSVACFSGFALATAPPRDGNARVALFRQDPSSQQWSVLAAGSTIDCSAYAPGQVAIALGC
ncbi:MAG TPA: hypothetical protein VGJ28_22150 [Micromonosporaceae bacterium]